MKILKINIQNLASLVGEFTIDFTVEPLKSAGIFAITGQTGSGKSTILDAIFLALYDSTPRLQKATEKGVYVQDSLDYTLTQSDPRSILSRGESQGYAQVEYIALSGNHMRATWTVARNRNRKLKDSEIRLFNVTKNIEIGDTKKEIKEAIVNSIGLTFEQFRRSVILAQGEFANFLQASQSDKAELLEKLTGTEIYSKISKCIYDKTSTAKQELAALTNKMESYELLSSEELTAIAEDMANIEVQLVSNREEMEIVTKKVEWHNLFNKLSTDLAYAKELHSSALKSMENSKDLEYRLALIDKIEPIKDEYNRYLTRQEELKKLQDVITNSENNIQKYSALIADLKEKRRLYNDKHSDFNRNKEELLPKIAEAREYDLLIKPQTESVDALEKECQELKNNLDKSLSVMDGLNLKSKTLETELLELDNWISKYQFFESIYPNVAVIQSSIGHYFTNKALIESIENNIELLKKSKKEALDELTKLAKVSDELQRIVPLEVIELRENLVEGAACPVCGSTHHPLGLEHGAAIDFVELKQRKKKLKDDIAKFEKLRDENNNQLLVFNTKLGEYGLELERRKREINALLVSYEGFEPNAITVELKSSISDLANEWSKFTALKIECEKEQSKLADRISNGKVIIEDYENRNSIKLKELSSAREILENYITKRREVLGEKSVAVVESELKSIDQQLEREERIILEEETKVKEEYDRENGGLETNRKRERELKDNLKTSREIVDKWLSENGDIKETLLLELASISYEELTASKKEFKQLNDRLLESKKRVENKQHEYDEHLKLSTLSGDDESLEFLLGKQKEIDVKRDQLVQQRTEFDLKIKNNRVAEKNVANLNQKLVEQNEVALKWMRLNEVFGSASGDKFRVIAQCYSLDMLLQNANIHLMQLSPRYSLRRIGDTLSLQIVDKDMLNEVRSVHSLSGGESFLVSLSLALALSSISSNRLNIESLFIDEGFGALDVETINVAMESLETLRMQGRKVGVISHVTEMNERIQTQIRVVKGNGGRSILQTS